MIILPAIDLMGGKCVRLKKGEYGTAEKVADDAVKTARGFIESGAEIIHIVDLDAAKSGSAQNYETVLRIIKETGAKVELGGGIRNMDDLERVFSLGVFRAIIGSAAVTDPGFVEKAVIQYAEKIAVGVDARGKTVRTDGWTGDSGEDFIAFSKKMEALLVKTIIFTDIEKDGMLAGPSFDKLFALSSSVKCDIIASGGVTSYDDIKKLRDRKICGAIIGKAYYSGLLDIKRAIEEATPHAC